MANHEINEEQEAVNKALRMIETSDPVHADVYNALFSVLINNDVFLEKLANKMVQQVMISHVMDSTNKDMVMGADQGPVITQLIEKVQEKVDVLNTNFAQLFVKQAKYLFILTARSAHLDFVFTILIIRIHAAIHMCAQNIHIIAVVSMAHIS